MSANREKIKRLAHWISRNPEDSFSKFALALELLKNNQPDKTLILFESIRRQDPEYAGVYYHLGKLYQAMDRLDDAETCFREGIGITQRQNETQMTSELNEALAQLLEEKT